LEKKTDLLVSTHILFQGFREEDDAMTMSQALRRALKTVREKSILISGTVFMLIMLVVIVQYFGQSRADGAAAAPAAYPLTSIELLGKYVFYDKISVPNRMACVTCHDPTVGGTLKNSGVNLHQVVVTGADPHTAGSVKPPTNAYATFIDPFFSGCPDGLTGYCGGNFWNGRSEGNESPLFPPPLSTEHIGDEVFYDALGNFHQDLKDAYGVYLGPVADQALNPFPNPVEQNIERLAVCQHVASAKYAPLFQEVWGEPIDLDDRLDVSYERIAVALAAFQASAEINSFSSKRDIALARELEGIDNDDTPGDFPLVGLTEQENYGHDLFYATRFNPIVVDGVTKFSNCSFCHSDVPGVDTGVEPFQCYSDDAYHNIGVPGNPEIPYTGKDSDEGLAGHTGDPAHRGLFKAPCLRNVDKRPGVGFTKAYTHNGWFKSLESIVHFYNTAFIPGATAAEYGVTRCPEGISTEKDALANNCWPAAPYDNFSAIPFLLGDLGLAPEDEAAIVAYLKTFTDTYTSKPPKPYKSK